MRPRRLDLESLLREGYGCCPVVGAKPHLCKAELLSEATSSLHSLKAHCPVSSSHTFPPLRAWVRLSLHPRDCVFHECISSFHQQLSASDFVRSRMSSAGSAVLTRIPQNLPLKDPHRLCWRHSTIAMSVILSTDEHSRTRFATSEGAITALEHSFSTKCPQLPAMLAMCGAVIAML
jgi:hypothetical protein